MSNEHLERRLIKLQAKSARLQRELFLLQRHIKEFHHPLFETWEADILTRFIEVAHAHQARKLATGIFIGEGNVAERECISRGYVNAARHIQEETVKRLGLPEKYHEALLRYEEVRFDIRSPRCLQICEILKKSAFAFLHVLTHRTGRGLSKPEPIPNRDALCEVADGGEGKSTGKVRLLVEALPRLLWSHGQRERFPVLSDISLSLSLGLVSLSAFGSG